MGKIWDTICAHMQHKRGLQYPQKYKRGKETEVVIKRFCSKIDATPTKLSVAHTMF